ncbi:hypothetical protein K438DRAFT_2029083 [Mycena galopus ATCC 62051]|nr:hypothetical protein K438DRAFT_2029083 [Mycena galopus ATCC 62051]
MTTNNTTTTESVRDDSLWFTDGTVVLQAENHLFRLSLGILAAKSPVFQDMLAFPQPKNGETYDGCPMINLSDSAQDATHFLKAIFHYDYFEPWPAEHGFHVVAGVLRLSQKYQVVPLRIRALVHLSRRYPISLEEFGCTDEWGVDPILVANLARHASADWVLPSVLSSCAWVDPEKLLNGTLAPSDAILCLRARDQLQTRWSSRVLEFLWKPLRIPGCVTPDLCLDSRLRQRELAETWREEQIIVLYLWNEDNWFELEDICPACLKFMNAANNEGRQACWDNLPRLFDLPDWPALVQMRYAADGFLSESAYF